MIASIVFWYFMLYAGTDWESPVRIFNVYGPYGSKEDCLTSLHGVDYVGGSINASPCFEFVARKAES